MRKTANPFSLLHPGPCFTKQRLLWVLRHAAGQAIYWHYQLRPRHPERFRTLTEGERNLRQICQAADELDTLLIPFRRTRPKGYEALRELFVDADAGPTLLAQVEILRACHTCLYSYHAQQQVDTWRQEWEQATVDVSGQSAACIRLRVSIPT
jgi:hypothetical protein